MKTIFTFFPRMGAGKQYPRWVFASLPKAVDARDKVLAAGGRPGTIWADVKDPARALACAFQRDGYTVRQVVARLNRVLRRERLIGESLGIPWDSYKDYSTIGDTLWDSHRGHLAVFAQTGTNEGHFVDVGRICAGRYTMLAHVKLWDGMANAQAVAKRATELLGA